ncbi:MAG: GNAT family N-acetyltransferase [Cardiobacteriaceae bacterium]|nr:GNAT family N-acetyltransferase [Cardiobacteriaceae bacterium]
MSRQLLLIPQSALPQTGVFGRDLPLNHYRRYLGEERNTLFYDASNGLHINAFLALAATLRHNKALCLYLPESESDPDHLRLLDFQTPSSLAKPRFNERLRQFIANPPPQSALENSPITSPPPYTYPQAQIIIGKRGRGKTTYLANKLAWLKQQGYRTLVVLPYRNQSALHLMAKRLQIPCLSPDDALYKRPTVDALLLDEASSLKPEQVLSLTHHYPHYTLAATLDGYEGYGQWFQHQLLPLLITRDNPQCHTFQQAYRYAPHDALESLLEQIFLYQHYPKPLDSKALCAPVSYAYLNPNDLAHNEALLRQVYALLNLAHYQTNPEDLKRLLDLPHQHLVVAHCGQEFETVVGVVYAVEESALAEDLARDVMLGKRRPQGRLLLQQLLLRRQQLRDNHAWLRISRLAIHPDCRRQGIATTLLQTLQKYYPLPLGVSYHANNGSHLFWQAFGFKEIIGNKPYNGFNTVQILESD